MLKNLLQKVFNFGQEKDNKTKKSTGVPDAQKKSEVVSECFSLLRAARSQRDEKRGAEALVTLEKIIDIMEREGL
ncbi:MAG: hypothetical protein FWG09_07410 [Synergistaceae bacterium]|nr:hypothetical protein [Synergistaceae bacterium]